MKKLAVELYSGTAGATAAFRESPAWDVITVDLDRRHRPTIIADCRALPFKLGPDVGRHGPAVNGRRPGRLPVIVHRELDGHLREIAPEAPRSDFLRRHAEEGNRTDDVFDEPVARPELLHRREARDEMLNGRSEWGGAIPPAELLARHIRALEQRPSGSSSTAPLDLFAAERPETTAQDRAGPAIRTTAVSQHGGKSAPRKTARGETAHQKSPEPGAGE